MDCIVGKYKPPANTNEQNVQKTCNNQTPINHQTSTDTGTDQLLAILKNKIRILEHLATGATRATALPQMFTVTSEKSAGTLAENQTARLLAWLGLSWTQQHLISPLWVNFLAESNKESR